MSRMPGAKWTGEHGSRKMVRYDAVCIHTIVGHAPAHAAHFSTDANGGIYQSRDTAFQSAANLEGNYRIIAIENADMPPAWNTGDGHAVPDFTPAQVESIAKILVWCNQVHGIPLVPCPDSRSRSRGIAYHRQGIDGNFGSYAYPGRVPGGERWTKSRGKVCPGDRRIKTLLERIIPRAVVLSRPVHPANPTPPPNEEDEVKNAILWCQGPDGVDHAYHVMGNIGKWLAPDGLATLRFLKVTEVNTNANPVGPAFYNTIAMLDGPLKNVA